MNRLAELILASAAALLVGCGGDSPTGPDGTGGPVYPTLQILTTALSDALAETPYHEDLEASGGSGSYTWTVAAGALPAGLWLNTATGVISGIPTAGGTRDFTVEVASSDGQAAQRGYSITVTVPPVLAPSELCTDYPDYAIATFEDESLEAAVLAALSLGTEESPTCGMVQSLEGILDADQTGVASLPGIQNLTALTGLQLEENSITDVSALSGLTGLEVLMLGFNPLRDVTALSGLTNLTKLSLDFDGISDVAPLSGLTALTWLSLRETALSDIAGLSGLTKLASLDLTSNQIHDLSPLAGLTELDSLSLAFNAISGVGPLGSLTGLASLSLAGNAISDIGPLAALRQLTTLGLGVNSITDVTALRDMTGLVTLDLFFNAITDIGALAGLSALREVDLKANSITDIGPLGGLPNLQHVDLSSNAGLSNIQPLLGNSGVGSGDTVNLRSTAVSCDDVAALAAKGVQVLSDCS